MGALQRLLKRLGPSKAKADPDFPPKPQWKPDAPINIPRIIETFAYYCDRQKTFAIFKHGTCVLVPDDADSEASAKKILHDIYFAHPDFSVRRMDDGNYAVVYSQPAYSVVFQDELEANRDTIDRHHREGVVAGEALFGNTGFTNQFDEVGKIGLFARARMFLDAQEPFVVHVWRPTQGLEASDKAN